MNKTMKMQNTKIKYQAPTLCESCLKRGECPHKSKHIVNCNDKSSRWKYDEDKNVVSEFDREAREQFAELKSKLRKVFSRQLHLVKGISNNTYSVQFTKLTPQELTMNSHGHAKVRLDGKKYIAWRKWCEQCGSKFETVNETREICDECWREICGMLGACYADDFTKMLDGGEV